MTRRHFLTTLALLAVTVGTSPAGQETPEQVYARYHAAMLKGDLKTALSLLYGHGPGGQPDDIDRMIVEALRPTTPPAYKVVGKKAERDQVTLTLSTTTPNGPGKGTIVMLRSGSSWKVGEQSWSLPGTLKKQK